MDVNDLLIKNKIKNLSEYNYEFFSDTNKDVEVFLFSISTCQWCKKGKAWLKEHKISYYYLDVDLTDLNYKKELKREIRKVFKLDFIAFPFIVVNGEKFAMGFNREKWDKLFKGIEKKKKEKTLEEVETYIKNVAKKRQWKLHSNHDGTLDMLIEGLTENFNRLGYFNCPCRDTNGDMKLDRDIICPCDYAELDIEEYSRCYCALFFKKDYSFSKDEEIEMIPDRRPSEKYV